MSHIQKAYDALVKEKEDILKSVEHLEAEKETLLSEYRAAEKAYNEKVEEIKAITQPRLYEVSVEIGQLSKMLPNNRKFPEVAE